jgi:hypothetical protein
MRQSRGAGIIVGIQPSVFLEKLLSMAFFMALESNHREERHGYWLLFAY